MKAEIRIKACNELTAATLGFHLVALGLCLTLNLPPAARLALSAVALVALWRAWTHAGEGGLRCLWLDAAETQADVNGVLRVVRRIEPVFVYRRCASFILHCADGERIKARVFEFGVEERPMFRSLCRRLNTGVAW